jgi:hypothetical protein
MKYLIVVFIFFFTVQQAQAQKPSVPVKVNVTFIVEVDGQITNAKVESIECSACTRKERKNFKMEAIRIVEAMPNMIPEGETEPRRTRVRLPIKFTLGE